jgi:ASC-1-like (ASCH) protein
LGNAKIRGCYGTYLETNRLNDEKRKLVRVGDIIRFQKLPNLDEEFIVDIKNIEVFDNWYNYYSKY